MPTFPQPALPFALDDELAKFVSGVGFTSSSGRPIALELDVGTRDASVVASIAKACGVAGFELGWIGDRWITERLVEARIAKACGVAGFELGWIGDRWITERLVEARLRPSRCCCCRCR